MSKFQDIGDNEDEKWIAFHCPGCEESHAIPVKGKRGWAWNGSFDSPTISPSLLVNVGGHCPTMPICHSFIKDGFIQFLGDCTHSLAGQTVEIPDYGDSNAE